MVLASPWLTLTDGFSFDSSKAIFLSWSMIRPLSLTMPVTASILSSKSFSDFISSITHGDSITSIRGFFSANVWFGFSISESISSDIAIVDFVVLASKIEFHFQLLAY